MERALLSLLMEEFMDDSLEVDNLVLQTASKVALGNLAVLACFDDGNRAPPPPQPQNAQPHYHEEEVDSPEPTPPKKKRAPGPVVKKRKKKRRLSGKRSSSPVTIEVLAECVIAQYSDMDFRAHFQMSRSTFEDLCIHIAPSLAYRTISAEKKVLLTIWILSSRESYGVVSDRFSVSKGFLHGICSSVCSALSAIQKDFIKMPETQELDAIAKGFHQRCGFPGVVGAIGCTHIPIREPTKNRESYINKEGSFSMQLQVVCDDQLKFLHVHTGCPGAMHNTNIFKQSPLYPILEGDDLPADKHLIGDCSYPLRSHLLVPFTEERSLTPVEKKFNESLSYTRTEVELAVKLFKQKFLRLKFLDIRQVDDISTVISAACVLYNFILHKENIEDDINEAKLTEERDEFDVDLAPEPCPASEVFTEHAIAKRMEIASSLMTEAE